MVTPAGAAKYVAEGEVPGELKRGAKNLRRIRDDVEGRVERTFRDAFD